MPTTSRQPAQSRAYKEATFQQLRSFCETARLGGLAAAATSLGLSYPTVWKQVHALERELGARLIEPFGRGCRLTPAGRSLVELAVPPVAGIASLKAAFQEGQARGVHQVTVVTTPRTLVEDLPACLLQFRRDWPNVQVTFREVDSGSVSELVESQQADLGLSPSKGRQPPSPWLRFEPCYELEYFLVTRKSHPLARRSRIRLQDLCAHPLVNAPDAIDSPLARAKLSEAGVWDAQPRFAQVYYATSIRRAVELGFGIGLVPGLPGRRPAAGLHERSLRHLLGRLPVYLIWRNGALLSAPCLALAKIVRQLRGGGRKPRGRGR